VRCVLAFLGCLSLCLGAASSASAASPAQAVANLNAQRQANGIPAGIREDPALSLGCAHHNAYERANNGDLIHDEDPGRPGYTLDGDAAAARSVLSKGTNWDRANPWETAPIHLSQLLAPRLDVTGVDDSQSFTCAQTLASRNRPAPAAPVTYTYPGKGTKSIYVSETAFEAPLTPGETVGIPQGRKTGPYLMVFFDGPWSPFADADIAAASLTGPKGPLQIQFVDNLTPQLQFYLPTGGMIIPLAPLQQDTSYTASVSGTVTDTNGAAPVPVAYKWTFRTVRTVACKVPKLKGRSLTSARSKLRRAHCKLGRVHYRRGGRGRYKISAQGLPAGAERHVDTKVSVTLRKGG
jgi:hypothetical protein